MNLADSTPTFHCKGFSRLKSLERLISCEHRYIDPMKFHFYFGFAANLWHTEAGNRVFRIPARCFWTRTLRSQNTRILWASIFNDRGIWMGFKSNSIDGKLIFPFLIFSNRNQKVSEYFFFFFFYKSWNLSKLFIYVWLIEYSIYTKYHTYFRIIGKLFKNKIRKCGEKLDVKN